MTPQAALIELLARLGVQGHAVLVTAAELAQWPAPAVTALKKQKLLTRIGPAASAVCPGCEDECVMPVRTLVRANSVAASFIVCDKRSDTNRVAVAADQLVQWRCDVAAVCQFVATCLDLRQSEQQPNDSKLLNIGMVRGDKRSQMLALRLQGGLALVVGNTAIPLVDLVDFGDGHYAVNAAMVGQMVDAAPPSDPRHTPGVVKREARKLATQAKHDKLQKAYRDLLKKSPGKTDVWYSQQLAKTAVGKGYEAETIRKNMKF